MRAGEAVQGPDLHNELGLLQALHAAVAHDVCHVVLVVREAVQCKGGVVLQIPVLALQQLQKRPQPARLPAAPHQLLSDWPGHRDMYAGMVPLPESLPATTSFQ